MSHQYRAILVEAAANTRADAAGAAAEIVAPGGVPMREHENGQAKACPTDSARRIPG
jgi:hypothetical protein